MNYRKLFLLMALCLTILSCGKEKELVSEFSKNDLIIREKILTSSFSGNGVQWGGYDLLSSWTGNATLSEADWEKLFKRVHFMHPSLLRIMVTAGWNYTVDGKYDPSKSEAVLCRILSFCQQEGFQVILGEWGHTGGTAVDSSWLSNSVKFLDWLINTKGYSCIRYFNMVNEPNGNWSSINGNYPLWKSLIEQFHTGLVEKGLDTRIKIIGPDVAVWNTGLVSWVANTATDLNAKIGVYDIHTYPDDAEVRDGSYQQMVKAYRDAAPLQKEMLMAELGFKYDANSTLGQENLKRIAADKYASDDSNMFVYDAFYALDMADAMMQNMLAGAGGCILWNLDDAMYNVGGSASTKLKRWGFWNILGTEKFENPEDENLRPWFYTSSLMCKYFPRGMKIHAMTLPDKFGCRAVAGELNGKYSIALVNTHTVTYSINLKMDNGLKINNLNVYRFKAGDGKNFNGATDSGGFAAPEMSGQTLDLTEGKSVPLSIPAKSFCLMSNIE